MTETFEERLAAVERALTEGDHDCSALADGAATAERVSTLESELEELTDRVAELEAATQALRGYVGNVRAVNDEVEQRADEALAKATAAQQAAVSRDTARSQPQPDRRSEPTAETESNTETGPNTETSPNTESHTDGAHRYSGPWCDRCERPITETDTPQSGSRQSRLEALGGDDSPVSDPAVGATTPPAPGETDGGATGDDESPPDLLARVRDLV